MEIRQKKDTDSEDILNIMNEIYYLSIKNKYNGTLFVSALLTLVCRINHMNNIPTEVFEIEMKRLVHLYGESYDFENIT